MPAVPVWAGLLALLLPLPFFLTVYTNRFRDVPGVVWLLAMNTSVGLYILTHTVHALFVRTRPWLIAFEYLQFTLTIVASVLWFVFLLAYTGQVRFGKRGRRAVGGLLASLVVLNLSDSIHGRVYAATSVLQPGQVPYTEVTPGILYVAQLLFVFLLGLVGIGLLTRVLVEERRLFSKQALALLVGSGAPYIAAGLDLLDVEPAAAMPLLPFGFFVTGAAVTYAATRGELFEVVPATRQLGEDTALEQLPDGVVITALDGTILNANSKARQLLDTGETTLYGTQFAALHDGVSTPEELPATIERQGAIIETNCSAVESTAGKQIGYSVRYSNISEQVRRQQRLEVLHRVIRHNLRNKMTVIRGYTDHLRTADSPTDTERYRTKVENTFEDIVTLAEKSRVIEQTLDTDTAAQTVDVETLLEELGEQVDAEWSDAAVDYDVPPATTCVTNRSQLRTALWNLVENGVEHTDDPQPVVSVTASPRDDGVEFAVEDNGPGIPSNEIQTIEAGTETKLQHGSGLGLWLVKWCVQDLGGTLDIDVSAQGTTVHLFIPSLAE